MTIARDTHKKLKASFWVNDCDRLFVMRFQWRDRIMSTSQVRPYEAGLQQRAVIVEFDSYEAALAAHESKAYREALQALGSGAERDFRIVEGA